ncbi:MAG: hypothetical protein ACLTKI_06415, partial [Lachnospiraceae bacterium]
MTGTNTGGEVVDDDILMITAKGFVKPEGMLEAERAKEADLADATASWVKAGPINQTEIQVNADELAAINSGKEGIYDLTFSITKEDLEQKPHTASVTVKVVVTGDQTVVDPTNTIVITANGFTVSQDELQTFMPVTKANAKAYIIATGKEIPVSADTTQLGTIRGAGKEGGIFDLGFFAQNDDNRAEITVKAAVEGSHIVIVPDGEQHIVLKAKGFSLTQSEKNLTRDQAITKADAEAYVLETKESLKTQIKVPKDSNEGANNLETIADAPKEGGIYDLTFSVTRNAVTASKTVKVAVEGDQTGVTPPDPDEPGENFTLAITADNVLMTQTEANNLTDHAALIAKTGARAFVLETGESVTDISIDETLFRQIKNTGLEGGVYKLTLTAKKGTKTAETTVTVV